ncbi:MAG: AbrB/MazE/SpoVT family DNA-binding domain-containing protein [Nitrospirota bacterium]|nr:AbrB/MazE/SpoVT family DNA-binding domain-containing protein [Nitrospirota bacterium]
MDIVKLGKKGQISIPKAILRDLALQDESMLLVEPTPDGGILLRPAGIYPIERYSDTRLQEFSQEDILTPEEAKRAKKKLKSRS